MPEKIAGAKIGELLTKLPHPGIVTWIGIRSGRGMPVTAVEQVEVIQAKGLAGDHYKGMASSTRHVTLIQAEHLASMASFLGMSEVNPALVRRNIVIKGLNLLALKDKQFFVGSALLEMTGLCHPCSRMEEVLGEGGYNAMRGHGGITARIIQGGTISIGDQVVVHSEIVKPIL
ncbi:MOSC domain-containing protein [Rhodocytophaga rosea]|uniref:MOSC domain-containing protein n=1 Tax=Rhodocytophaga rosea TaxID=2704465 RepID=A0A6C0GGD1_9BACT|nr:MOSC domain-containing protein [Rhodocytophaga rosea]QHT67101.1 MOSC domain-containing protein [Rhodocytophaga rosea]